MDEGPQYVLHYNLDAPDFSLYTRKLTEISGMSWYGNNSIIVTQQLIGLIYVLDLEKGKIIAQHKIPSKGINQGLTAYGDQSFVIKSNGIIYGKKYMDSDDPKTIKRYTYLHPQSKVGGMTFDYQNFRLLIATNTRMKDGLDDKKNKVIYELHAERRRDSAQVAYIIDTRQLADPNSSKKATNMAFGSFNVPKNKQKGTDFSPSSIAIHPYSRDIYVMSAKTNELVVLDDESGEIVHVEKLNPEIFISSKGMTFDPNGNLYIATLHHNGFVPKILTFRYRGPKEASHDSDTGSVNDL